MPPMRDADSDSRDRSKGKLIFHSKEHTANISNDNVEITEKIVTHAEDKLFCKYYHKKGDMIVKYDIQASTDGGEYVLTKTEKGERTQTKHNKKEILDFLSANKELDFIKKYIATTKSLKRPKTTSKRTASSKKKKAPSKKASSKKAVSKKVKKVKKAVKSK